MSGVNLKPKFQWHREANKSATFELNLMYNSFLCFFRKCWYFKLIFEIYSGLLQHPLWFWRGCEKHSIWPSCSHLLWLFGRVTSSAESACAKETCALHLTRVGATGKHTVSYFIEKKTKNKRIAGKHLKGEIRTKKGTQNVYVQFCACEKSLADDVANCEQHLPS